MTHTQTVILSFILSFTWSQCVLLVNLMREGPRFTTPFHIKYEGNQVWYRMSYERFAPRSTGRKRVRIVFLCFDWFVRATDTPDYFEGHKGQNTGHLRVYQFV